MLNPRTKKRIAKNGATYRKLVAEGEVDFEEVDAPPGARSRRNGSTKSAGRGAATTKARPDHVRWADNVEADASPRAKPSSAATRTAAVAPRRAGTVPRTLRRSASVATEFDDRGSGFDDHGSGFEDRAAGDGLRSNIESPFGSPAMVPVARPPSNGGAAAAFDWGIHPGPNIFASAQRATAPSAGPITAFALPSPAPWRPQSQPQPQYAQPRPPDQSMQMDMS